jgi:hypothetical protein
MKIFIVNEPDIKDENTELLEIQCTSFPSKLDYTCGSRHMLGYRSRSAYSKKLILFTIGVLENSQFSESAT